MTKPAPMHGVWNGPIQICSFGSVSRMIVPGMAHMIHAVEYRISTPDLNKQASRLPPTA